MYYERIKILPYHSDRFHRFIGIVLEFLTKICNLKVSFDMFSRTTQAPRKMSLSSFMRKRNRRQYNHIKNLVQNDMCRGSTVVFFFYISRTPTRMNLRINGFTIFGSKSFGLFLKYICNLKLALNSEWYLRIALVSLLVC